MIEKKNSLLIFVPEYAQITRRFSNEEKGIFFDAILDYFSFGFEPNFENYMKTAFDFIKNRIDDNNKKYEEKCSKNKQNGKNGGRPKTERLKKQNPKITERLENKTQKNPDTDTDTDTTLLRSGNIGVPPFPAVEPEKPKKEYVFDGKVIHLIQKHYDDWQRAFPNLNLYAELVSRDDWLATQPEDIQKKWFPSTAQYLGKRDSIRKTENENKIHDEFLPHSNVTDDTENEEEWYL